ncbi:hypothetical protein [Candidatus Albibeggiatoa sp. nov. BB20]|uniref:hypothetical protein n=1 Tax=Candidatus Albibeggiatoa sp. nov. BB20 TaxID=3162723 RepID=UPI00336558BF
MTQTAILGLIDQPIADAFSNRIQQVYTPQYGDLWENAQFPVDIKNFTFQNIAQDSLDLKWTIQASFCAQIQIRMLSDILLNDVSEILLDLKLNPIIITEPVADNLEIGTKAANFILKPLSSDEIQEGVNTIKVLHFEIETGYLLERIDRAFL